MSSEKSELATPSSTKPGLVTYVCKWRPTPACKSSLDSYARTTSTCEQPNANNQACPCHLPPSPPDHVTVTTPSPLGPNSPGYAWSILTIRSQTRYPSLPITLNIVSNIPTNLHAQPTFSDPRAASD